MAGTCVSGCSGAGRGVSLLTGMWGAAVSSPAFPLHFLLGSNAWHWTYLSMTKPHLCRDALRLLLEEKELSASNQGFHCLSHSFLALPHRRLTGSWPRGAAHQSLCTSPATGQGLTDEGTEAQGCQTKRLAEVDKRGTCPLPGLQTSEPGNCRGSGSFPTKWRLLAGFPRVSGHKAGVVGPSMRHQGWAGSHWVASTGGPA